MLWQTISDGAVLLSYVGDESDRERRWSQASENQLAKPAQTGLSGQQLTPFGRSGRTVLLEDVSAIEAAVQIEVIVDRGVDRGEFLQGLYVPKFRHRTLPSSEWLV